MSRWIRTVARDESGVLGLLAVLLLLIMFGVAAMAVDLGHLALVKGQLQKAADAGALAGAGNLYSGGSLNWDYAAQLAAQTVRKNKAEGASLTGQAQAYYYNLATKQLQATSITPTSNDLPAVQVTILKTAGQNGGPVQFAFAPILGIKTRDVSAQAVAIIITKANYAVLAAGGGQVTISSGTINGDVGKAGGSYVMSGGTVDGKLCLQSGVSKTISGGSIKDGIEQGGSSDAKLTAAAAALQGQMAGMDALANTMPGITQINSSTKQINGGAGVNVLDVSSVILSGGNVTLDAPSGGSFIIRVSGQIALSGGTIKLSGGLTDGSVIFYDQGGSVAISGGNLHGSILGKNAYVAISGGNIYGQVATTGSLAMSGGKITPPTTGSGSSSGHPQIALVQ